MGYIYNERTGEFKTRSQLAWSILLLPFRWLLAPFCFFVPLLRLLVTALVLLWRMIRSLMGLLAWPVVALNRQFPILIGVLEKPFAVAWHGAKTVALWVFYPAIKWWEMAKDAIGDKDWFLLVVWCVPGYLILLIYWAVFSPFFMAIIEIARLIPQLSWGLVCMVAQWVSDYVVELINYIEGMIA